MKSRALAVITLATLLVTGCGIAINRASDYDRFRDPEIAMVLRNFNLAEIREGDLARDHATAQPVKDFGAMMASEHAQSNSKTENELAKKEIFSADSNLSRQIDSESGKTVEALRTRSGADFDRAYLDRSITFHRYIVDTIDKTLKPAAKAKQVKAALDETRAAAEKHLAKAEEIRKGM
jgi:putative membrane protein